MPDIESASETSEPVHVWFGLTRSAYLVVPRLALQAMPLDWQRRLVQLLEEADAMGLETPDDYRLFRPSANGRLTRNDPWQNYRRGDFEAIHGKPLKPLPPKAGFDPGSDDPRLAGWKPKRVGGWDPANPRAHDPTLPDVMQGKCLGGQPLAECPGRCTAMDGIVCSHPHCNVPQARVEEPPS